VCRGAMGIVCEGCILPRAEVCDGRDNDCDGTADKQATCSSGFACREGRCTLVCKPGEFPCPAGYQCVDTFCIPQRCMGVKCPSGQKCDNDTGSCVDVCDKVVCTAPALCKAGVCVDCNSPGEGCPTGQMCLGGTCMKDPCLGVSCGSDSYCSNGS